MVVTVGCGGGKGEIMRESTWNLREGFDKIRWNDDIDVVRSLYPDSGERKKRTGVNPATGEALVVNAGLSIREKSFSAPVPSDGINLRLSVGFDDSGRLSDLFLMSDGGDQRFAEASSDEWEKAISMYSVKLAGALGLDPYNSEYMEQDWNLDGVRVEMLLEGDGFSLTVKPSGR